MTQPMTWISPGEWTAMSNEGVWVLADVAHDQQLVTDLWQAASVHGITADQVLGTLLAHGFDKLRGLAIVAVAGESIRVIVRHPAAAHLENGDDSEDVVAEVGATWVDITRPRPARLLLGTGDAPSGGLELPLALGASAAKALRIQFATESEDVSSLSAEPDPSAELEPPSSHPVPGVPAPAVPLEVPVAPAVVPSFFDEAFGGPDGDPDGDEATSAVEPVEPTQDDEAQAAESVDENDADFGAATAFMSVDEILAEGDEPEGDSPSVEEPGPRQEFAGPTVFAVRCGQGHLSSPMRPTCRVCNGVIPEQKPFEVETPPLGVIVVPSGDRIPVDNGIAIGRSPQAAPGSDQQTITISFSGEISRQHAEITVAGWNVYVRDLNTTNGTSVTSPDRVTVNLRAGENYLIEPGSEIDLADVVTLRFEAVI